MEYALDTYGNIVFPDEADRRQQYRCPSCKQIVEIRNRGMIRRHCFAHQKGSPLCVDTWNETRLYDEKSTWHRDLENLVPKENREVRLKFGGVIHRADIVIGDTIIELQHSKLSSEDFDNRTSFYQDTNAKLIWLFDAREDYENGLLYSNSDGAYCWENYYNTFDNLDSLDVKLDIFLQIKEPDDNGKCIIRIDRIEDRNIKLFSVSEEYSIEEFFEYSGKKDGVFPLPAIHQIDLDPAYLSFKGEYGIQLDAQQERAIQRVNGASLILAVPGSGKTTVLTTRLAYMTICRNVDPSSILALTYTSSAAEEMKTRFCRIYGSEIGNRITFKTINSLCNEILKKKRENTSLVKDPEKKRILMEIIKKTNKTDYVSETEIMNTSSGISLIKNLMFTYEEIDERLFDVKNFKTIYTE